ncbi:MAG: hypothetical protein ACQEVQ_07820 [Pseudomonadota bacterium]
MFTSNRFFRRFLIIALVLNLPPLVTPVFIQLGLEPVLLIALLMTWVNAPFWLGLEHVFSDEAVVFSAFGVQDASMMVWLSIVAFWLLCAGVLAAISLVLSSKRSIE